MRLASVDDRMMLVQGDRMLDVASASEGRFGPDPTAALDRWPELTAWAAEILAGGADGPGWAASAPGRFGPPVPRPRQVFGLALNYPMHADEVGLPRPADPLVFTKYPTCLTGPDAAVELSGDQVDWEIELVVVIGVGGRRIPAERAWSHVAGVTVGQDLSDRKVQTAGRPAQFSLGKSFPGYGPVGPVLVTPDELPDPDDLPLSNRLNGEVMQDASTGQMLFGVPELLARISAVLPLLPGDLIFTGTPAGVGARQDPPRFLRPGDELVGAIAGVGEIRTRFVAGPGTAGGGAGPATPTNFTGQAAPASSAAGQAAPASSA